MKHIFAEAVIGFYLWYPRRRNSILGSFLKYRKMAAVIEVSCSEPLFDSFAFSFGFTNYDTFAQVLIILNSLLPFLCFFFALLIVNKN